MGDETGDDSRELGQEEYVHPALAIAIAVLVAIALGSSLLPALLKAL